MSLLAILFWLLVAVVIVVTAALVLPVGLRIEAMSDGPVRWKVDLQPFGRFGPRFRLPKPKTVRPKRRATRAKPSLKRPRHPGRLVKAVFRLVLDLLSDTGQIYGLISPFLYSGNGLERVQISAEPVFDDTVFKGRAMLELAIVPIALLPPVVRFGWTLYGPTR